MRWFEDVMFYGFKDNSYDPDDEDTNFIPRLAEKALVPKLTGFLFWLRLFNTVIDNHETCTVFLMLHLLSMCRSP